MAQTDDPFYSESNQRVLRQSIQDMKEGRFIIKTMEELEAMAEECDGRMKGYKFKYHDPQKPHDDLEELIASDMEMQSDFIGSRLLEAIEERGISNKEFSEVRDYLQKCLDKLFPNGNDADAGATPTKLLMYATALGATLKITLEWPDGRVKELL